MARPLPKRQTFLRQMFAEVETARLLFLDGLLDQAGLHLCRAWHALACVQALDRDAPLPEGASFVIDIPALPPGARLVRQEPRWSQSLAALLRFSPFTAGVEHHAAIQAEPGQRREQRRALADMLRYQLRAAQQVHAQLHRRSQLERMGLHRPGGKVAAAALAMALLLALIAGAWHIRHHYVPPPLPSNLVLPLVPPYNTLFLHYSELRKRKEQGAPLVSPGTRGFADMARVRLGRIRKDRSFEVSIDADDAYTFRFLREGREVAELLIPASQDHGGLRVERREVPAAAVSSGYDLIEITHGQGDGIHIIGHLILGSDLQEAERDAGAPPAR